VLATAARKLHTAAPRRNLPAPAPPPPSGNALPKPARAQTAVLLNDTSHWYHFGCSCTSLAMHAELRPLWESILSIPIHRITRLKHLPRSIAEFDDDETFAAFAAAYPDIVATLGAADTVYVNGEGALHNVGTQALGLLYLMYVASARLHRPVHLVNHSCYPDDTATLSENAPFALYRKVYEQLEFVAVRETLSANLVEAMGVRATATFDCLPLFIERHFRTKVARSRKRVLIAGSVSWGGADVVPALAEYVKRMRGAGFEPELLIGANAYLSADDFLFVDSMHAVCGEDLRLVNATSEREWLATIAGSALLVCGRFHHTIAAAFLDTPCIVMESNTPKIAGILQMLGLQAFVSVHEPALSEVLYERSFEYIAHGGDVTVAPETKRSLLELGRKNFAGRPAARGT
jgi:polysaccharide pyruvyl transferase WcaK-like protein